MNKPIHSFRSRGINVAIWKNEKGYSITLKKSYKDRETGEWKDTGFFFPDEAAIAASLLQMAFMKVATLPKPEREAF